MRKIAMLWALWAYVTAAHGTTIVVIRTPEEVVIAADSTSTIQGDGLTPGTATVCKIYEVDNLLFFAISGLANDARSGFSIPQIVATDARAGGSISARLARMERDVTEALLGELPKLKGRDPGGYEKLVRAKGAVTVMLAGMDDGSPMATSFSIGLTRSDKGLIETNVTRESCPGNCTNGVRAFWFGEGGEIERLIHSGGLPQGSMAELAEHLVEAEISAHAPNVGGPVDVLRIRADGPVWVHRKPGCPATAR